MECVSVKEDRVLEIASTINKLDGPLVVLGYFTSLSADEIEMFFNNVKNSKYGRLNFYNAVKMYSADYVRENGVLENNEFLRKFGYNPDVVDWENLDYGFKNVFLYEFPSFLDENVTVGKKSR